MTNKEKFDSLLQKIEWNNWQHCDADNEPIENNYWDITEVLRCKLNWLIQDANLENDEHLDTIKQVQTLLELLNEEKIKKVL